MPKRNLIRENRENTGGWIALGAMVLLDTLAYSTELIDASNIIRYTIMAAALCVISLFLSVRKIRLGVPFTIGMASFALFVLLQGISMLWAPNFAEALHDASKWLMILIAIILSYNLFKRYPARMVVVMSRVSAIAFLLSLLVAWFQVVSADSLSWDSRYKIVSLFTHKGTYSMMLLLMASFPIMRLLLRIKRSRWFYALLIVAMFSTVLFLQSRAVIAAFVAVVLSGVVLWLLRINVRKTGAVVTSKVVVSIIVCFVMVYGFRWFVSQEAMAPNYSHGMGSNTTAVERQMLWRTTFRMIDRSPWIGCGVGNWKVCYPRESVSDIFSVDVLDYVFVRPHNDYLRIVSETGFGALFLMMLAISSVFVDVVLGSHCRVRKLSVVSVSFMVGVFVFAVFDFPFDRMEIVLWSSILMGCAMVPCKQAKEKLLNASLWYGVALFMFFFTVAGMNRWHSESLFVNIRKDIHNRRWSKVEANSRNAHSVFCNISPVGVPYKYYEGMACEYQHKPAIDCFRSAVRDCPYNKQALCDLGRLEYLVSHDTAAAVAHLKESIRISPCYSYPYFNLVEIFIRENRLDEAVAVLESMDLARKKKWIDQMVWLYVREKDIPYYYEQMLPAEESSRRQMLSRIQLLKESNNQKYPL